MKVILTQDVRGQGKRGQMIEVSDGYARNFLLPRKLAQEATADNINTMRMNDKATQERQAKERAEALELRNRMKDMTVVVTAKGGGAGRLFGSVTNTEVSEALAKQAGIQLDKRKIVLDEPIKSVGVYTVKCKLGYEINAELKSEVKEAYVRLTISSRKDVNIYGRGAASAAGPAGIGGGAVRARLDAHRRALRAGRGRYAAAGRFLSPAEP